MNATLLFFLLVYFHLPLPKHVGGNRVAIHDFIFDWVNENLTIAINNSTHSLMIKRRLGLQPGRMSRHMMNQRTIAQQHLPPLHEASQKQEESAGLPSLPRCLGPPAPRLQLFLMDAKRTGQRLRGALPL